MTPCENPFTDVFESAPNAIVGCDAKGIVRAWNPAAERLFGFEKDQALGRPLASLFGVSGEAILSMCMEPEGAETDMAVKDRGGRPFLAHVLVVPKVVDGRRMGAQLFVEDRSAFRELESRAHEAAMRYRRLVNRAENFAIFGTDAQGCIDAWNSGAERLLGYSEAEALGQPVSIIYTAEDRANGADCEELSTAATHGVARDERWHARKDGSVFWANGVLTSATDELGRLTGFVKTLRDETQRKLAEDCLTEERQRLDVVLQSLAEGVIATDELRAVVLMNPEAEVLTGWTRDEAYGRPLADIFQVREQEQQGPAPTAEGSPTVRVLDAQLRTHDGREIPISYTRSAIADGGALCAGQVIVLHDARPQKRAEQQLILAEKLAAIGAIAGGIAHQFNNLMTGLFGNISLAKHLVPPDGEVFKILEEAEQAFVRAQDLTHRFLTFAEGGRPLKRRDFVQNALQQTADFIRDNAQVQVKTDIEHDLWPVEFDAQQLRQVLLSVLLNAREAMGPQGAIELAVCNERVDGPAQHVPPGHYVVIRICDTGVGIPAEVSRKAFDPFFSTKPGHVGLGLATAQSIIRGHHGHIRLESRVGQGTRVYIHLPAFSPD